MTTDTMRAEFEAYRHNKPRQAGGHFAWLAFQFAWQASAEAERGRVIEEAAKEAERHARYRINEPQRYSEAMCVSRGIRALNRTAAQQET